MKRLTIGVISAAILLACVVDARQSPAQPGPAPAFVVIFHPPPLMSVNERARRERAKEIEAKAFVTMDEALKYLEDQEIDEGRLVGIWKLTDAGKVEVKATETPVAPVVVKKRRWQKKP